MPLIYHRFSLIHLSKAYLDVWEDLSWQKQIVDLLMIFDIGLSLGGWLFISFHVLSYPASQPYTSQQLFLPQPASTLNLPGALVLQDGEEVSTHRKNLSLSLTRDPLFMRILLTP
ncbi:MAG: hypothetical protein QXE66_05250 [Desulfurococcaceae archaeon]